MTIKRYSMVLVSPRLVSSQLVRFMARGPYSSTDTRPMERSKYFSLHVASHKIKSQVLSCYQSCIHLLSRISLINRLGDTNFVLTSSNYSKNDVVFYLLIVDIERKFSMLNNVRVRMISSVF